MLRRLWSGLVWLAQLVSQNIRANATVGGLILRPRRPIRSGLVRIPLELKTDAGITMLGHSITLIPGTITVDVAPDRSHLLVHVLVLDNPQATIDEIVQTLGRPIRGFVE